MNGACLCGAVSFRVAAPSLWAAHCHCSLCRHAHGAAFVTWLGTRAETTEVGDAESQLRWFDSSPGAQRGFCARCGSSLFFRGERWPGELHIAYANFQSPPDRQPQAHVYFDTHVPWLQINDELPRKPAPAGDGALSNG